MASKQTSAKVAPLEERIRAKRDRIASIAWVVVELPIAAILAFDLSMGADLQQRWQGWGTLAKVATTLVILHAGAAPLTLLKPRR